MLTVALDQSTDLSLFPSAEHKYDGITSPGNSVYTLARFRSPNNEP